MTAPVHVDPQIQARIANLVIAGVGKSGTSSLFAYLAAHPDIAGSTIKETHYFSPVVSGRAPGPLSEYASFWPDADGATYRLEATPLYCLGGGAVIDALESTLPAEFRVVIALRDPLTRLFSNYTYMRSKGQAAAYGSFEEYVDACLAHDDGSTEVLELTGRSWSGWRRSYYGYYLPIWLERLGDRLRVVYFEDLARDPAVVVESLFRWLGVDETVAGSIDFRIHNATAVPRLDALRVLASSVNRLGAPLWKTRPRWKRSLVRTYARLNGTPEPPPYLDEEREVRLRARLEPSNRILAVALRDAGYDHLPSWLTDTVAR